MPSPFAGTSRVKTLAKIVLNLKMAPALGAWHVVHVSRYHCVFRHRGYHSFCRGSLRFLGRQVVILLHAQSQGSGTTVIASV